MDKSIPPPSPHRRNHTAMHVAMLAATFFWAANIIAIKEALQGFGSLALTQIRISLAGLVFLVLFLAGKKFRALRLTRRDAAFMFFIGLTGVTLNQLCFIAGLERRTKIVCTIGPATSSRAQLRALLEGGMNVARLNFSHGEPAEHAAVLAGIRALRDELGVPSRNPAAPARGALAGRDARRVGSGRPRRARSTSCAGRRSRRRPRGRRRHRWPGAPHPEQRPSPSRSRSPRPHRGVPGRGPR